MGAYFNSRLVENKHTKKKIQTKIGEQDPSRIFQFDTFSHAILLNNIHLKPNHSYTNRSRRQKTSDVRKHKRKVQQCEEC